MVCNRPEAGAIGIAEEWGLPLLLADHETHPDRFSHERLIAEHLAFHRIELVVLAGYMRLLSPFLVGHLYDPALRRSRILNIHPADTAAYQGVDGYAWAIRTNRQETCITVHFVDEGMDTGEVVMKKSVSILRGESVEELRERGLKIEHRIYPEGIKRAIDWIEGKKTCAAF